MLDGTAVRANSLPKWLTPAKGGLTSATVDESAYVDIADQRRYLSTRQHRPAIHLELGDVEEPGRLLLADRRSSG